jgi:glycosyltransferase involved in cell wall biosynthesis
MIAVHLTSSTFFGGPERQMLGLAEALRPRARTILVSFREAGRCRPFLDEARRRGFEARAVEHDTPRARAAIEDVRNLLQSFRADVLCCHGYKADLLGQCAARRTGVPVVAVSRGWTGESRRVRLYERLDRWALRRMDRVVCVSAGQASQVRRAGVREGRIVVVRNAIDLRRFGGFDPRSREEMLAWFPKAPARLIGAAGRLSPEKGFGVLIAAAKTVARADGSCGFVLFGEGPLRAELAAGIAAAGLAGRFVLMGFRSDLDRLLPGLDLLVLPSFTEGLPNVALEACAARVPIVATAVGGTPEVVLDGVNGYLVPPRDPAALAGRIRDAIRDESVRHEMGQRGRSLVEDQFTFEEQARHYLHVFEGLRGFDCFQGHPRWRVRSTSAS